MSSVRDFQDAIDHSHEQETAMQILLKPSPRINHVERLPGSDKVIVWGHIVCESCRLCETQGDVRGSTDLSKIAPWTDKPLYPEMP